MNKTYFEIRWHGRGGQGTITAAKIVAAAAFGMGYAGVVMAPSFGTERRGAPVMTSLKISKTKIYDLSPIETPDVVVALDHLLLKELDITCGLKRGGIIVLNTPMPSDFYSFTDFKLATANITAIAVEAGLPHGVVNTGIIGALERAIHLLGMDPLIKGIEDEFQTRNAQANALAAKLAYAQTVVKG